MVQAILMILAQQLRMLERPVDYRSLEEEEKTAQGEKEREEADRESGKEREKTGKGRKKTGRESEKSTGESEDSWGKSEQSESASEKSESEKSYQDREYSGGERDGSERKTGDKGKASVAEQHPDSQSGSPGSKKKGRGKDKTSREKGKSSRESKEAVQEKQHSGGKEERAGLEDKDTSRISSSIGKEDSVKKEEKPMPPLGQSVISITDKDKVLVVEQLPAAQHEKSRSRAGSIAVVTLSQFRILEAAVKALEEKASPLPLPSMPDNQTLRDELTKGSASLTGTMQAMQMSARVQAAEDAINRMADLLTDMAASGHLPQEMEGTMKSATVSSESKKASTSSKGYKGRNSRPSVFGKTITAPKPFKPAEAVVPMMPQVTSFHTFVTHPQLDYALGDLKNALTKLFLQPNPQIEKLAKVLEYADKKAGVVGHMEENLNKLNTLAIHHAEQLAAVDADLNSQIDAFNGQFLLIKSKLQDGVKLLEKMNSSDTQAITELGLKFNELVELLEVTIHTNKDLLTAQHKLDDKMRGVLTTVEMLLDEKSDRDEMWDRLQDKADISALDNMLLTSEFDSHKDSLEKKLALCYEKFETQERVWQGALQDMVEISNQKSGLYELLLLKEETEKQLNDINKKLQCLTFALGEPKAAILARKLAIDANCGVCRKPALQEVVDKNYGKPSRLPPVRGPNAYIGAGDPCVVETNPLTITDKQHACRRWVGGSHTLVNASVKRDTFTPARIVGPPTRKYTDSGDDGRLYNMEEPLDPCQKCNPAAEDAMADGGRDPDFKVYGKGEPQTADKLNKLSRGN